MTSHDRKLEYQKILSNNMLSIFPMSRAELFNWMNEVYQRIKDDDVICLPCSIADDDKNRCVYFIWSNHLKIYFEFRDSTIHINDYEFGDEAEDEAEDYVSPPEFFRLDQIDLLIDFLRDCFTYGKIRYPMQHYLDKFK